MKVLCMILPVLLSGLNEAPSSLKDSALSNDGWIFKCETDHIKVWYRIDSISGVYAIRATTSFNCQQADMVALIDDVRRLKTWGYKTIESSCLRKINEDELYYYARYETPWPLSDRDLVMHQRKRVVPETGEVHYDMIAAPTEIPEKPGLIRIKYAHSSWRILPTKDNWTYCEWTVSCDPGGSLPDWGVNLGVSRGPIESIKGIRRVL